MRNRGAKRTGRNGDLFAMPDEGAPVHADEPKPDSPREARLKKQGPLLSRQTVTMEKLWKDASSIETKSKIHWNTSGPFGGSTTHAACGKPLAEVEAKVLVEHVTCPECQRKASQAWDAMARYSRGIEPDEPEE